MDGPVKPGKLHLTTLSVSISSEQLAALDGVHTSSLAGVSAEGWLRVLESVGILNATIASLAEDVGSPKSALHGHEETNVKPSLANLESTHKLVFTFPGGYFGVFRDSIIFKRYSRLRFDGLIPTLLKSIGHLVLIHSFSESRRVNHRRKRGSNGSLQGNVWDFLKQGEFFKNLVYLSVEVLDQISTSLLSSRSLDVLYLQSLLPQGEVLQQTSECELAISAFVYSQEAPAPLVLPTETSSVLSGRVHGWNRFTEIFLRRPAAAFDDGGFDNNLHNPARADNSFLVSGGFDHKKFLNTLLSASSPDEKHHLESIPRYSSIVGLSTVDCGLIENGVILSADGHDEERCGENESCGAVAFTRYKSPKLEIDSFAKREGLAGDIATNVMSIVRAKEESTNPVLIIGNEDAPKQMYPTEMLNLSSITEAGAMGDETLTDLIQKSVFGSLTPQEFFVIEIRIRNNDYYSECQPGVSKKLLDDTAFHKTSILDNLLKCAKCDERIWNLKKKAVIEGSMAEICFVHVASPGVLSKSVLLTPEEEKVTVINVGAFNGDKLLEGGEGAMIEVVCEPEIGEDAVDAVVVTSSSMVMAAPNESISATAITDISCIDNFKRRFVGFVDDELSDEMSPTPAPLSTVLVGKIQKPRPSKSRHFGQRNASYPSLLKLASGSSSPSLLIPTVKLVTAFPSSPSSSCSSNASTTASPSLRKRCYEFNNNNNDEDNIEYDNTFDQSSLSPETRHGNISSSLSSLQPLPQQNRGGRDHEFRVLQKYIESNKPDAAIMLVNIERVIEQWNRWFKNLPRVNPHYAVKCNDDSVLLKTLANLGASYDCASQTEMELIIRTLRLPSTRIIYSNPCKQEYGLNYARKHKVFTTVFDNEEELYKIEKLLPQAELLLRIETNDKDSQCPLSCKFGAPASTWSSLLNLALSLNLRVRGVHFHVGSGCSKLGSFTSALEDAHSLFLLAEKKGIKMDILNIGGGFPGGVLNNNHNINNTIYSNSHGLSGTVGSAVITFEDLASEIRPLLDLYFPAESGVRIIAEPGRYFAASSHTLAVKIYARRSPSSTNHLPLETHNNTNTSIDKGISSLKREEEEDSAQSSSSYLYYINDGVYGSFNCLIYDHAEVVPRILYRCPDPAGPNSSRCGDTSSLAKSIIFGQTCDGFDCILKDFKMPVLEVGDWLLFNDMGAYTIAASSTFNGFSPPKRVYVRIVDPTSSVKDESNGNNLVDYSNKKLLSSNEHRRSKAVRQAVLLRPATHQTFFQDRGRGRVRSKAVATLLRSAYCRPKFMPQAVGSRQRLDSLESQLSYTPEDSSIDDVCGNLSPLATLPSIPPTLLLGTA